MCAVEKLPLTQNDTKGWHSVSSLSNWAFSPTLIKEIVKAFGQKLASGSEN